MNSNEKEVEGEEEKERREGKDRKKGEKEGERKNRVCDIIWSIWQSLGAEYLKSVGGVVKKTGLNWGCMKSNPNSTTSELYNLK